MVVAALWVGSEELQGVLGIAWAVGEGGVVWRRRRVASGCRGKKYHLRLGWMLISCIVSNRDAASTRHLVYKPSHLACCLIPL